MQRRSGEQQNKSKGTPADSSPTPGATAAARAESTGREKESPVAGGSATHIGSASQPGGTGASQKGGTETSQTGGTDLIQQAKQTTSTVVDQVQHQANSRLNQQKENAATELKKVADAVRQLGDGLTGPEQGVITSYAADYGRKAAENIERLTNYLRENDARKLVSEIENFGRRRPAWLLGGAFVLGLVGARFLKSSTHFEGAYSPNVPGIPPTSGTSSTPGTPRTPGTSRTPGTPTPGMPPTPGTPTPAL